MNDTFQVDYLPEKKEIRINLPEEVWKNIDTVIMTRLFQEELVVEKQKEALSEDITEKYHNPADITLLRKAKDCLKQGIKQLEKYINYFEQTPEEDACIEMYEIALEIDKVLGENGLRENCPHWESEGKK